jgi:hypothetical protein
VIRRQCHLMVQETVPDYLKLLIIH